MQETSSCGEIEQKRYLSKRRNRIDLRSEQRTRDINSSQLECTNMLEFSLPTQFGKKRTPPPCVKRYAADTNNAQCAKGSVKVEPFDICLSNCENSGALKTSLHEKDAENWNDVGFNIEGTIQRVLRPGMVLLKNYITHKFQVLLNG